MAGAPKFVRWAGKEEWKAGALGRVKPVNKIDHEAKANAVNEIANGSADHKAHGHGRERFARRHFANKEPPQEAQHRERKNH